MNTSEASKFTGIPEDLLIKMRHRKTSTLHSGPPFSKVIDKDGIPKYQYHKISVKRWLKTRNLLLTAGEAASILGIEREEILKIRGIKRFDIKKGFIVVAPAKNLFVFVLNKGKARDFETIKKKKVSQKNGVSA